MMSLTQYIKKILKTTKNTVNKKKMIDEKMHLIFERAYELEQEAIKTLKILSDFKNINYEALQESALKQALQEWKENKNVFNCPNFLKKQ